MAAPSTYEVPARRANRIVPRISTAPTGKDVPHPAKARRTKTVNEIELPGEERGGPVRELTLERLQDYVFQEVVRRLRDMDINVASVSKWSLRFMLPRSAGSAGEWQRLLAYPMLITDTRLASILQMETSNRNTSNPEKGSTLYYVRSSAVTVNQLTGVLEQFEQQNLTFDEVNHWKAMTEYVTEKETVVYVRYIGMSSSVSAWQRYATDLVQRTDGVYGHFVRVLTALDPQTAVSCSVYSFPQALTHAFRGADGSIIALDTTDADIREQGLIALRGKATLLNRQSGGFHTSYDASIEDKVLFQKLKTAAFPILETLMSTASSGYLKPSTAIQNKVNQYIHKVCELGRTHPIELGTDAIPTTDANEITWAKQATPATIHGHALLVFVADYCPLEAIHQPALVWEQSARAVRYLKDTLSRYIALEIDAGLEVHWQPSDIMSLSRASLLPWVDLQYTPKRKHHRMESAELLRQYLGAVRPLIVPTFERNTSNIIRYNFVGFHESHGLLDIVGVPEVQYWTHPGEISGLGMFQPLGSRHS